MSIEWITTTGFFWYFIHLCFLGLIASCDNQKLEDTSDTFSDNGNTPNYPISLDSLNTINFNPGDTIFLRSGQLYSGTLVLESTDSGDRNNPIVITSSPGGKAIIDAGEGMAVELNACKNVVIFNLKLVGSGRKWGNTQNGLLVSQCSGVMIDSVDASGFLKAGVSVKASENVTLNRIHAHDNGYAGIAVSGAINQYNSNIKITECLAENNPGDPTNLTNHSGNGIVVGYARNVTIDQCIATNNGWDMPRIGNGPVGIWAYESDSVVIQRCIAYRNKTSVGGEDGGGFDLDGGVTNSILQYCLSFENQGSGIGLFQFKNASRWNNNTVRFNISINDGLVSTAHAGIYVWNAMPDATVLTNCNIYNNVIFNEYGAALCYNSVESEHQNFNFYNNILVGKDEILAGEIALDKFQGNNWWSIESGFKVNNKTNLESWANETGQEKLEDQLVGLNINPGFSWDTSNAITDPVQLSQFFVFQTPKDSELYQGGLDLFKQLGIVMGDRDFNGNEPIVKGIGASF